MHILPIASGKGGVGKSLVAANLSIALAQAGKRVILADLDLGASNLHIILGIPLVRRGIGTFLSVGGSDFGDLVMATDYPGLRFIPGDAEIPGLANINQRQKASLIRRLLALDADYLVLDLGAGTSANILDFFLMSSHGIIVTTPSLTATLNAYLFLKNTVFRLMYSSFGRQSRAFQFLEALRKDGTSFQKIFIPAILEKISQIDPENHAKLSARMSSFRPKLVLNMLDDPKAADKAAKIRRSAGEYLNVELEHLGVIYRDSFQDVALGSRIPVIRYKPQSPISQAIYRIADKIVSNEDEEEMPLTDAYLDETFQAAEMEAEIDFEARVEYVEDLLQSGVLTMADLVETVRSQQFEIGQLRRENQLYKFKVTKAIQQGFKA
ncbi:MAG: P-loop NTPase [Spirochaetes bacterium]|nr:P-loop NTPase [Spirochaetota bacterium]